MNTKALGIIGIILGLLIIIFPFLNLFLISIVVGISILFLGIWLVITGIGALDFSKLTGILSIILGIIALIIGICITGNIFELSAFAGVLLWISGVILVITGLVRVFSFETTFGKVSSGLMIVLGIIYIILGIIVKDPLYLALLLGISLIVDGVFAVLTGE